MKGRAIFNSFLLIGVLLWTPLATISTPVETLRQGSGCPYVCREEYKLCVKRKGKKCRTKLNSCLRMCPK